MKIVLLVAGTAVLLLGGVRFLPAAPAAAGQGSEWEITTTMEIAGMPFAMPPSVIRQCLEDRDVPYQSGDEEECRTISKKVSGDTVFWRIICQGEGGPVEMDGVTRYTGDTMDSKVEMRSDEGDMSMHMTGRCLGPCK